MYIDLESLSRGWTTPRAREGDRSVEAGGGESLETESLETRKRGSWLARLLTSIRRRSELRRKSRECGRLDARTLKDIGLTPEEWHRDATLSAIREARP